MNPIQIIQHLMSKNTNPMFTNVIKMAQEGNREGVEQFARNICKERSIDFDKEFKNFLSQMNIKG